MLQPFNDKFLELDPDEKCMIFFESRYAGRSLTEQLIINATEISRYDLEKLRIQTMMMEYTNSPIEEIIPAAYSIFKEYRHHHDIRIEYINAMDHYHKLGMDPGYAPVPTTLVIYDRDDLILSLLHGMHHATERTEILKTFLKDQCKDPSTISQAFLNKYLEDRTILFSVGIFQSEEEALDIKNHTYKHSTYLSEIPSIVSSYEYLIFKSKLVYL